MDKREIKQHFEQMADGYDRWKTINYYYLDTLKAFFKDHTGEADRVVEFGCGTGEILAAVNGAAKTGLDIAQAMVHRAREKFPELDFQVHDCELPFAAEQPYDVAILSDIIDHITDILKLYVNANKCLRVGGRMCISTVNPLWDPVFKVAEKLHMKMPEGEHNFVPNRHLVSYLELCGFRLLETRPLLLVPRRIPLVSDWFNRVAPMIPLLCRFCVVQTLVAEKVAEYEDEPETGLSCSVVIPCYNEEENIESCIARVPRMGAGTEIIVVDDGSSDQTAAVTRKIMETNDNVRLISYSPNHGKGYAVKQGFDNATGDVVMILDADMTVEPEELPLFFRPFVTGTAGFVNGTRMIYPMEEQAMRFANLIGNFLFGSVVSWLLSQQVSDTLCGTKALRRADYANITMGGDKWGDYDLLFGAAETGLRIVEVPVHYRARTGGVSKMQPFKHCLILIKVCLQGFFRLKLGWKRGRT